MRTRGQRRRWRTALVVAVVANLVLLFWPGQPSTGGFFPEGTDKVVHVLSFAAVAVLAVGQGLRWVPVVLLLALHAVESELVQHLWLPGRSGDPWDVAADLTGVLLGTLAGLALVRSRAVHAAADS